MSQLPLHRFESIVHHLGQWFMRAIVHLFFFRHQFVPRRDGDIDADPERIPFFMGMIRLLDRDVTPADVIAKFIEARRFLANHLFNPIALVETAVSDVHWQLHINKHLRAVAVPAQE
jgi:hypothetical protein